MANTFPNDAGRKKVDEQLRKLEAHLSSVYKQAASECQKELDEYLSKFRIAERIKRDQVKNGVITQSEYQNWARRQIFHTRQMQAKVLDLSKKMVNADKEAMAMINKELPAVYATSYNWGGFRGEKFAQAAGFDYTQFTIINKDAVRVLATEDPDLIPWKPMPDDKKDLAWNRQHIQQAIEQGIVQGDGIDKISKRLLPVVNMDETAARRTARTAVNSIENKGRKDATDRVRDAGIPMVEVWSCTHDSRTRDTHILLDGTKPNEDGYFGEGILDPYHLMQYPSDPNGEPKEVYNCRCRLNSYIEGIDHSKDAELYEKFMSENYEEDWETVKRDRQSKEMAFQTNKARAIEKQSQKAQGKTASEPDATPKAEPKQEFVFVPAKTKEEAEEYAKRFADTVNYKGISLENANEINKTLTDLTQKYPITKLEYINQSGRGKFIACANGKCLVINGKKIGVEYNTENRKAAIEGSINMWKTLYPKGMPKDIQRKITVLENKLKFSRWSIGDTTRDTITHEYGHIIADQYFGQANESKCLTIGKGTDWQIKRREWNGIFKRAKESGDIYNLSEYGNTNEKEFFAESFCARERGEKLPDYVEDFIRRLLNG